MRQEITSFLVPIQTTKDLNEHHFNMIISKLELLAYKLKGVDLVSKSFLNEIFVTVKVLRSESVYFENEKSTLLGVADKIEYLFELILKDECGEQRKSGVPRVC